LRFLFCWKGGADTNGFEKSAVGRGISDFACGTAAYFPTRMPRRRKVMREWLVLLSQDDNELQNGTRNEFSMRYEKERIWCHFNKLREIRRRKEMRHFAKLLSTYRPQA
jgi:hypothetical protein